MIQAIVPELIRNPQHLPALGDDVQRTAPIRTPHAQLAALHSARGLRRRINYAACAHVSSEHKALRRKDFLLYHASQCGIKLGAALWTLCRYRHKEQPWRMGAGPS